MRNYALGALVIIFGLYAYFGVYKKEEQEKEQKALADRFVSWSEDEIASLAWVGPGGEVKLVRDERGWKFETPFVDNADLTSVDNWLTSLAASQRKKEVYPAGEPFDPETYGLKDPEYRITVTNKKGETKEIEIGTVRIFGNDLYVHDKATGSLSTFGSTVETALKKPLMELRDRRVWRVKDPVADSVELVGRWKLIKDEKQFWSFEKAKADDLTVGTAEVNQYLVDLSNLRLLEVMSETSSAKDLREYGLDKPFAEVIVTPPGDQEPVVLKFGAKGAQKDPNNIFVTSNSLGFIGRLYSTVRENVDVDRSTFFDKSLPFKVLASDVDEAKFELNQKGGTVEQDKVPQVVSEITRLKLKEYLPKAPRLGPADSLSLRGSGENLVFKMTWKRLPEDAKDKDEVRVLLEPGKIAGKMRSRDIEDLVKVVRPAPEKKEEEGEQGESSSVQ